MTAGATGSKVIHVNGLLRPRVSLISFETADIDVEFSDIDVIDDLLHDIYGLGDAQYQDWQVGITLVSNALVNTTTPAHVATAGLMVSHIRVAWDNSAGVDADLHVFFMGEDENG
jgi:hypothetical protein